MTSQPVAENHSSLPVLSTGALAAQAGTGDFRDQPLWPSFLRTKGFSLCCQRHFSRLLGWPLLPPLSQGNTSYCEHHPRMVRHSPPTPHHDPPFPPSILLLLPTNSVLALSSALRFSPPWRAQGLWGGALWGRVGESPYPGLWLDRGSWGAFRETAGFPTLSSSPVLASNQEIEIAKPGPSPPPSFLHIPEETEHLGDLPVEGPHLKRQAGGTLVRNIFIASVRVCLCVRAGVRGWTRLEQAYGALSGTSERERVRSGQTLKCLIKSPIMAPQWAPEFQWESRVPSRLPYLPSLPSLWTNKSVCTRSGRSTWAHMDQRWFIKRGREGGRKGGCAPQGKKPSSSWGSPGSLSEL